jgi:hypothetical protein
MHTPGKLNITCYQGANFDKKLVWSIDGTPVDLTSYTAAMQVRKTHPTEEYTFEFGEITLNNEGEILIEATADETANIPAREYVYDLELTNGETVTRLIEGVFLVTPEVTRIEGS